MNPICNVLVIVDPTAAEHPAVAKGALLAQLFNARLELFACETKASHEVRLTAHAHQNGKHAPLPDLQSVLEMLADPLRRRGLDVTAETLRADPLHEALLDRARRTSAELIVKDTHHHTIAQRTFLTNTDWQLIRYCEVPLLLVKPRPWAMAPKLLAAIDPSHANDKPAALDHCILQHATALSTRLHGELHCVHAFIPAAMAIAAASVPPMIATIGVEEIAREQETKRRQIAALVSDYGVRGTNIHVEAGGSIQVLPRVALDIGADIVALGAISRHGVKRVFIGSTAEDVLERLPCDALVVKTPNFAATLPF